MKPYFQVTRRPYEEPHHVNLVVAASNGRLRGEIELYAYADDLTSVAKGLAGFPRHESDVFSWELGSEDPTDNFAFYYRFRVYPTSARGTCALELRFNNNGAPPRQEIVEFCLVAEPADLDRLAELFRRFAKLEHHVLNWTVDGGELRKDV